MTAVSLAAVREGYGCSRFRTNAVALSLRAEGFPLASLECGRFQQFRVSTLEFPSRQPEIRNPEPERLTGAGVVLYAPLEKGDSFGDGEGKQEHHQDQCPEFLHQEILRIKFKQLAHS